VGVPGRRSFETLLGYTLANARGLIDIGVWDTKVVSAQGRSLVVSGAMQELYPR